MGLSGVPALSSGEKKKITDTKIKINQKKKIKALIHPFKAVDATRLCVLVLDLELAAAAGRKVRIGNTEGTNANEF